MSLNTIFSSVLADTSSLSIEVGTFLFCIFVALVVGFFLAWTYTIKTRYTKSFLVTLSILPAVVSVVIMMVNGNIGAGVAVAGAFSLVRFRSVPGTAKEIGAIFLAMGTGLAIGMGFLGFAVVFAVVVSLASVLLTISPVGEQSEGQRVLTITIPESLDYAGVFDEVFQRYTTEFVLNKVKTTNMGSLIKLTYDINLVAGRSEKQFIDDLRCRNGNLEIVLARQVAAGTEL